MQMLGFILALNVIMLTIFLLVRKCSPSITLLSMGLLMFVLSYLFDIGGARSEFDTAYGYALFDTLYSSFSTRLASTGLLIMLFGGYISYMKKINASDEMIYVMMRPLGVLRNYPYLSALVVIPIGVLIYMVIPSATAMGLLLVATIYPVLLGIGVSRKSALSIISVCTLFDMGMASLNSNYAADLLGIGIMDYFSHQLSIVLPLVLVLIVSVILTNHFADKRDNRSSTGIKPYTVEIEALSGKVPLFYALLPLLPLIVLLILPESGTVLHRVSVALLISFVFSGLVDCLVKKSVVLGFKEMNSFWSGMGKLCSTAVVFMVCAGIFSEGLVHLAVPETIMTAVTSLDCGRFFSLLLIGCATFLSTFMVGSGVSFNALAASIPDIAVSLDVSPVALTMMMQLITGFARTASPIAVVVITLSQIAGISPIELARRNLPSMVAVTLTLIIATSLSL